MARRVCKVCLRPDKDILLETVKNGSSVRALAMRHDIHPRVLQYHFDRHVNGSLGMSRGGRASAKLKAKLIEDISVSAEAKSLLQRVNKVLVAAEDASSHSVTLAAVREAKGLLELLGRINGELQTPGITVNLGVGVTIDRAKEAVAVVQEAESLTAEGLADRAEAMLNLYNAEHPQDQRIVSAWRPTLSGISADPEGEPVPPSGEVG